MSTSEVTVRRATKEDYDYVVQVIDHWWGGPTSTLAHPIYFYEFGNMARVAECDHKVVGFLFGFIVPSGDVGYVHLVGIHPDYRRRQVGTALYESFEGDCRAAGCSSLKAITTTANEGSVRFHNARGWSDETVPNYAGPGRTRIVLRKPLKPSQD